MKKRSKFHVRNFAKWVLKKGWDIVSKGDNISWKNEKGDELTSDQLWDIYEDKLNKSYRTDKEKEE